MPTVPRSFGSMEEEKVIAYWHEIDAFQTNVKLSEGKPKYVFHGPPFATGLPDYGYLLAGTIKVRFGLVIRLRKRAQRWCHTEYLHLVQDTVTRYAHVTGYHITWRFGWDTHSLPVEHEIDKKLSITGREDMLKMDIDNYNAEYCAAVMRLTTRPNSARPSNPWAAGSISTMITRR